MAWDSSLFTFHIAKIQHLFFGMSLIGGRWRFHSSEAALPSIRSYVSTHWKRCKQWSAALTFQDTKFNLHAYAIEPHRVLPGWVLIKFHISDPKISAVGPSCFFTNLCNAPEIRGERKITNYVHVFWLRSAKLKQAWLCARLHKKSHNPFFTFLLIRGGRRPNG